MSYNSLLETFTLHRRIVSNLNYFSMMGVNLLAQHSWHRFCFSLQQHTLSRRPSSRILTVVEAQACFPTLGSSIDITTKWASSMPTWWSLGMRQKRIPRAKSATAQLSGIISQPSTLDNLPGQSAQFLAEPPVIAKYFTMTGFLDYVA